MDTTTISVGATRLRFWAKLAARLPASWVTTRRRRRLLFLAISAPGFFAVFGTPLHHNLFLTLAGFAAFAAAITFRMRTEPLFAAPADDPAPSHGMLKETPDA